MPKQVSSSQRQRSSLPYTKVASKTATTGNCRFNQAPIPAASFSSSAKDSNNIMTKPTIAELLNIGTAARELKLGRTFKSKNTTTAFHTMKYDFKPASMDVSRVADVEVGPNNQVAVTVPNLESSRVPHTVYKGNHKEYTKEYVLVIDKKTGEMTLEKLSHNIQVKKTRTQIPNKTFKPAPKFENIATRVSSKQKGTNDSRKKAQGSSQSITPVHKSQLSAPVQAPLPSLPKIINDDAPSGGRSRIGRASYTSNSTLASSRNESGSLHVLPHQQQLHQQQAKRAQHEMTRPTVAQVPILTDNTVRVSSRTKVSTGGRRKPQCSSFSTAPSNKSPQLAPAALPSLPIIIDVECTKEYTLTIDKKTGKVAVEKVSSSTTPAQLAPAALPSMPMFTDVDAIDTGSSGIGSANSIFNSPPSSSASSNENASAFHVSQQLQHQQQQQMQLPSLSEERNSSSKNSNGAALDQEIGIISSSESDTESSFSDTESSSSDSDNDESPQNLQPMHQQSHQHHSGGHSSEEIPDFLHNDLQLSESSSSDSSENDD